MRDLSTAIAETTSHLIATLTYSIPRDHSIVSALDKLLFLLKKIFFVRKTIVVDTVKKLRF